MLWYTLHQLKSGNEETRVKAVKELGELPAEQAIEHLMPALSDASSDVRIAVVRTLGTLGDKSVIELLVLALGDSYASVREAAVEELGRIGGAMVVQRLVTALQDADLGVRYAAINALERTGLPEAAQALSDCREAIQEIRQEALTQPRSRFGEESHIIKTEKEAFELKLSAATPHAYFTHIIIGLNIVVFLIMAATGAGLVSPSPDVLIKWGGNIGSLTTQGEWWRLITSAFVHIGIVHMALNMWVLYRGGVVVEKLYGNAFFLLIYLTAAVIGSLVTVVVEGSNIVSVGASGAVFGVYGALVAYLLIHRTVVPQSVLRPLMKWAVTIIGYNLLIGFTARGLTLANIGNADHVGGLIGGFLIGLIVARPLDLDARSRQATRRMVIGVGIAVLVVAFTCVAVPKSAYNYKEEEAFRQELKLFANKEAIVVNKTNDLLTKSQKGLMTQAKVADDLESECLPIWQDIYEGFASLKLGDNAPSHNVYALLLEYSKVRRDGMKVYIEWSRDGDKQKFETYSSLQGAANSLIKDMRAVNAKPR